MSHSDDFIQVDEVASHFGVTIHAVYKWARQGRIETRRLGRAVRITRAEFEYLKVHGLRESAESTENKMILSAA